MNTIYTNVTQPITPKNLIPMHSSKSNKRPCGQHQIINLSNSYPDAQELLLLEMVTNFFHVKLQSQKSAIQASYNASKNVIMKA